MFKASFKFYFFSILLVLLLSCNQKNKNDESNPSSEIDSIQYWIDKSKQKELSEGQEAILLDKAFKKLRLIADDSLKSELYAKLSFRLLNSDNTRQFRKVNTEGILLAKKVKDSSSLFDLYWDLGDFFKESSVQDSAYYYYAEGENIVTLQGNNGLSGVLLIQMATIQNRVGDYTASEITTIKAIEKLKPLNNFKQLCGAYGLLGDNAKLLAEYDRALEYYHEAIDYSKKAKRGILKEVSIQHNIGLVYQKWDKHQEAISYFSEALDHDSLQYKNARLYGRALTNLGRSYLKEKQFDQLPYLFEHALTIQDSIKDLGGRTSSNYELAAYHLSQKDTLTAFTNLERSKELALSIDNSKKLLEILRLFTKVDPKNASRYMQEYAKLNDSLQNQERQLRDKFARIRFETDEFIAENELLVRQKQLWTGIAGSLLLLGLATFVIVTQRNRNKILKFKQQQQARNEEIFNLLLSQKEKVEEGKKLEQKRVSEELHDGVLGRMLGTRMMLIGLNKRTDQESIDERAKAISILQEVEGEVRSISHELSHAAYQKIHNFILSVKDLLNTIRNSSKITIEFNYADDLDYDALSGNIKINLYRMIQEIIQNAVKHAECSHIDLSFSETSEFLRAIITDNGKGFIVKKGKKGIGMRNITSRMKKLEGTWDIDSTLGEGTIVTLVIPVVTNDNSTDIRIPQEDLQEF